MTAEVDSLKRFSFLIAATDPYIVLPGIFARAKDGGRVGDYAVVIAGDRILPAIVGDVGPDDKVGEASLRIAKEINALATPNNRPVSDLKVTYLIFPGTADRHFGPPDLEKIRARCENLVQEIGGASVALQLTNANKPDDALAFLQLNAEYYPNHAPTYGGMGQAYLKKNDKENAIKNFEKAVQLDPNNQPAKRQLEQLKASSK